PAGRSQAWAWGIRAWAGEFLVIFPAREEVRKSPPRIILPHSTSPICSFLIAPIHGDALRVVPESYKQRLKYPRRSAQVSNNASFPSKISQIRYCKANCI